MIIKPEKTVLVTDTFDPEVTRRVPFDTLAKTEQRQILFMERTRHGRRIKTLDHDRLAEVAGELAASGIIPTAADFLEHFTPRKIEAELVQHLRELAPDRDRAEFEENFRRHYDRTEAEPLDLRETLSGKSFYILFQDLSDRGIIDIEVKPRTMMKKIKLPKIRKELLIYHFLISWDDRNLDKLVKNDKGEDMAFIDKKMEEIGQNGYSILKKK